MKFYFNVGAFVKESSFGYEVAVEVTSEDENKAREIVEEFFEDFQDDIFYEFISTHPDRPIESDYENYDDFADAWLDFEDEHVSRALGFIEPKTEDWFKTLVELGYPSKYLDERDYIYE